MTTITNESSTIQPLTYNILRGKNIVDRTKNNYTGRIKVFLKWLREKHPNCFMSDVGIVDEDEDEESERNFDADLIPETVTRNVLENWLDDTLYHRVSSSEG